MVVGILGSFLPVLPGTPVSWIGLLLLHLTKAVPDDWVFLGITLGIAILVFALDYIIPVWGTKKFGGSKWGMIGTTVGLIVALIFPILGFFGIIIWPFVGALVGELINKADQKTALKAAFGSFLGFLTGTFIKFMVTIIYLGLFIYKAWEYKSALFPFL
ncbi:membrane protein [Arenibacter certesii]|uniref:Membrane protein n=2 Tax=Arenibacter certesii TaxID=228955 RepID=A0A918IXG2_9FLAO|nr:membrane protein [Arenibacter certesii]